MVRFEPVPRRLSLTPQLLWFLLWAAVVGIAMFLTPSPSGNGTHTQLGLPPCPSVLLYNKLCPGCGLTTSFVALVHGEVRAAFAAHAMGPAVFLLFTGGAFAALYGWIGGRRFVTNTRPFNWLLVVFFVAFFAYGAWRFAFQRP